MLKGAHQALARDLMHGEARDGLPAKAHIPRGRLVEAGDRIEGGGLAGAIRADQPVYRAFLDRKS